MRKLLSSLAVVLLGIAPAHAGDRHLVNPIGYSPDGHYFAFEEFGTGMGDASQVMSAISIIDVTTGKQVTGSPFSALGGEDDQLAPLRAKAAALAAPVLKTLDVSDPAQYVSMVGDGVAGANGAALRFGQPHSGNDFGVDDDRLLTLSVFDSDDKDPACEERATRTKGFSLSVSKGGSQHLVFNDGLVPLPPGCVLDYRLYGVVLPIDSDMSKAVALVSVLTAGFEGYDRGFVAVPVGK